MPDPHHQRPAAGASDKLIEQIRKANQGRKPKLLALKYERIAADAFAFFRGTLALFASQWSAATPGLAPPASGLGPEILSCGDLHVENFGAFETDDGVFCFDINDFDEALLAPAAFDLVRASTSILLGAQLWQVPPDRAAEVVGQFLEQYRQAVASAQAGGSACELTLEHGSGPIWELLGQAAVSTVADLLDRHTRLVKPGKRQIERKSGKHPELPDDRAAKVAAAVEQYGRQHRSADAFRVLDVTGRIAGIGSLGVRRYLVLIEGEGSPDGNKLLDIKEALPSAAAPGAGHPAGKYDNEAERIVAAQRQLQSRPTAGLDVLSIGSRWCRMRTMVPDENLAKIDRLQGEPERLAGAIVACGQLVGWSHARGAKFAGTGPALASYVACPLDQVLPAAQRAAEQVGADYELYRQAYAQGRLHEPDS